MRMLWVGIVVMVVVMGSVHGQDSLGMQRMSELVYWPMSGQIQVVRNLAYIYGGASGLHIVNIADPAHPQEVGRFTWGEWYEGQGGLFYVSGNRAYIGFDYERGLVIDVSDSTHPRELGWWSADLDGVAFVHDTWAIGIIRGGGPIVLDVSNPDNVHQIGSFPQNIGGDLISASGTMDGYACLSGNPSGLYVFDMSDPAQPVEVAAIDTTLSSTTHCVVSGNYAYLAATESGLRIIDLSNPLAPVEVAVCAGYALDVAIAGTHACVQSADSVRIWDVADPPHPVFVSSFPLPAAPAILPGAIAGTSNSVLVSLWRRNYPAVAVEDISNPSAPQQVSSIGMFAALGRFAMARDTAYVVDSDLGIRTLNLGDAAHIFEMGYVPGGSSPLDVSIYSHYAYLAENDENSHWGSGLEVFDVSNAAQPESLGMVTMPWSSLERLLIHGDYAYVFYSQGLYQYLKTFSLAMPALPVCMDSMECPVPYGIACTGNYLYIGSYCNLPFDQRITIYSLADPGHPVPTGVAELPISGGAPLGIAVSGQSAFVADRWGGLVTVDLTDPAQPTVVGQLLQGDAQKVAIRGTTLIVKWADRLSVMNVTDPLNPSEVGYYDNPEWLADMKLGGAYLYTSSEADFRVYEVDALGTARPNAEPLHEFALYSAYPNPFNPNTVIRFSLPQTGRIKLTIFDVTGREVKVLTEGMVSGGEHQLLFDGKGLASGVYFARLEAGKEVRTQKLMLLK